MRFARSALAATLLFTILSACADEATPEAGGTDDGDASVPNDPGRTDAGTDARVPSDAAAGSDSSIADSATDSETPAATHAVSGVVNGLTGTGLVLTNNGGDAVAVTASGGGVVAFTFVTKLAAGATYAVAVQTDPSAQTCTVTNGSGTMGASTITDVVVDCAAKGFLVGGNVTGLTSGSLLLRNNGGDDKTITSNGAFSFATKVTSGATYDVKVVTPPGGLVCSVTNGQGTASADVTNVAVACSPCTGTQTFDASGTATSFAVPACATSVTITAAGAQGGTATGGKGAQLKGTFAVTGGEALSVVVGKQGVTNGCNSGGGGGGSFVWRPASPATPLIAVGGGGGGNTDWSNTVCRAGLDAVIGADGTGGNSSSGPSAPGGTAGNGGSGTAASGVGAGGAGWLSNGQNSTYASPSVGGSTKPTFAGGGGSPGFAPGGGGGFGGGGGAVCGCGGGGGYSGGGGGEGSTCRAGGGGGGSYNAGTSQVNTAGARSGDGVVTFTW